MVRTGFSGIPKHHTKHEDGNIDEIDVTGLTGAGANSIVQEETRAFAAASGDVAYTGYGFQPTGIFITARDTSCMSMCGCGVNKYYAGISWLFDGTHARLSSELVYLYPSGGNVQSAILKSFDADGFTLTWTKTNTPVGTGLMTVFAFKG